ncbi:hypothetical protein EVJ20_13590 [Exiguobacterium sp. SH0S1]|uniref:hypothetical protein n=1 Tax=Exiguobacterium sp. SH0S1 TaxID=2510949 RepID=UPI001040194F|nr:hypothetical protein [Exiguobacterium sp. SH0S1]TCI75714.1 hypothetical protein EVJ20_13585 [Exiguobacterium sp. SH0S1]TCI75715.1 hypothetical protein EVJ20_13590 [Exiguobacterium sp. SH0S1]
MNTLPVQSIRMIEPIHSALENHHNVPVVMISRRRFESGIQNSNRHLTYHQFIHRMLPNQERYAGDYMNEAISSVYPREATISAAHFANLFRSHLNGNTEILRHFDSHTVAEFVQKYKTALRQKTEVSAPIDFEDFFVMGAQYLSRSTSRVSSRVLFIPDYEILLERPELNRNAIQFIESLIKWCVAHNRPVYTLHGNTVQCHRHAGRVVYDVNNFV